MSTTFGDFLTLADENITAVTGNATPVALQAAPAVIGELADLTAVMARCVDAFVMHDQTSDTLDEPARAILDARVGLHHAAARMRAAAEAVNLESEM